MAVAHSSAAVGKENAAERSGRRVVQHHGENCSGVMSIVAAETSPVPTGHPARPKLCRVSWGKILHGKVLYMNVTIN